MGVESQKRKMLVRARAETLNPTFPLGGGPRAPSQPSPREGRRDPHPDLPSREGEGPNQAATASTFACRVYKKSSTCLRCCT